MEKIKALIFDFDGVILDTETAWGKVLLNFSHTHNLNIPDEEIISRLGFGDDGIMEMFAESMGSMERVMELRPDMSREFAQRASQLKPKDGVRKYLSYAREHGLRLGLASCSDRTYIKRWLGHSGLEDFFQVVVTGDDVSEDRLKPQPDLYIKVLEGLGVDPREAVAFEDSPAGIRAAETAGITCVMIESDIMKNAPQKEGIYKINMGKVSPEEILKMLELEPAQGV